MKLFARHTCFAAMIALLMSGPGGVRAHQTGSGQQAASHSHAAPLEGGKPAAQCAQPELRCAKAAMPYFAPDGSLWVIWSAAGTISLARSEGVGRPFGERIEIARHGEFLDTGPDARPQLVGDQQGNMVLAYSFFRDKKWNAQVNVVTSGDQGKTFSAPRSISADSSSQRFASLRVNQQGQVFVAWIDKREVAAALTAGQQRSGASIAFAWSDDAGKSFQDERLVRSQSCECCRIAMALTGQGMPAILYRAIFEGGVRDHASQVFAQPGQAGPARRVATDNWTTDICPHHGPALAISGPGTLHAAWFTQGSARSGIFYARSSDQGEHYSAPRPIGNANRQPGRPDLYAKGQRVWLVWKEFDGKAVTVWSQQSRDDGASWSAPSQLAKAVGYTDHPLLVSDGTKIYLSWLTAAEGYRLLEVKE